MKYKLAYVCPLCGGRVVTKPVEATQDMCIQWMARQEGYVSQGLTRFLDYPEVHPHKCPDGSVGIARLAGFIKVE